MRPRRLFICAIALALSVTSCAPGSPDPTPQLPVDQRSRDGTTSPEGPDGAGGSESPPDGDGEGRGTSPGPGEGGQGEGGDGTQAWVPAADTELPQTAADSADAMAQITDEVFHSIDRWMQDGDVSEAPPRRLVLQALYQQRLYRHLARRPTLARRVIARVPGGIRGQIRANVTASAKLFSLIEPISGETSFRTQPPLPAGTLLEFYREAERRFGVDWEVLAAINYIETKFGRVISDSHAGAQGPMQFIPSTWEAYGMGGDVHDPHDAILGAANYLAASGAPDNYRNAVYAYNHAWPYVDAVLIYARQMMSDPRRFLAYYNWQLFVLTTEGDVRLSGPGLEERG